MKTRRSAPSAHFNLAILLALAAVGVLLTTLVVYGAERTRNSKPQRQRFLSGPAQHGSVTEAGVNRIDGPAHGSDHGHDVKTDAVGNVLVTGWIETSTGNTDSYTVKYSPEGDLLWAKTYAGSPTGVDYGYALAVDQSG